MSIATEPNTNNTDYQLKEVLDSWLASSRKMFTHSQLLQLSRTPSQRYLLVDHSVRFPLTLLNTVLRKLSWLSENTQPNSASADSLEHQLMCQDLTTTQENERWIGLKTPTKCKKYDLNTKRQMMNLFNLLIFLFCKRFYGMNDINSNGCVTGKSLVNKLEFNKAPFLHIIMLPSKFLSRTNWIAFPFEIFRIKEVLEVEWRLVDSEHPFISSIFLATRISLSA